MNLDQKRVFQCIKNYNDKNIRQIFMGLNSKVVFNSKFSKNIKYENFNIRVLLYDDKFDLRRAASSLKPDIFVSGSEPILKKITLPSNCRRVHISHGIVGTHANYMNSVRTKKTFNSWVGANLYCGAGSNFEGWIKSMPGYNQNISEFVSNAIPQFDIIYQNINNNEYKDTLISQNKIPKADKYILFGGFGGFMREDFIDHNEDYYRTALYLEKIAKKNNWFVFIKPRVPTKRDHNFVKSNAQVKKYADDYIKLWKSDSVCMINRFESIYDYFFSDIMMLNGTSTLEIEMCCTKKPVIIVRTEGSGFDPLSTISLGGAKLVDRKDIDALEDAMLSQFEENIANYDKILEHHNITFDGKMNERVNNAILKLL